MRDLALVTGAGTRLGYAIAQGLAGTGYAVALHYNSSRAGVDDLAGKIRAAGGEAEPVQQDLSDLDQAGGVVGNAADVFSRPVRVLVNSAAGFQTDSLTDLTRESWDQLMAVNAAAPVFLMQAMARQDISGGAVVNILDTQMTSASPERFSYFCAKFALLGATRVAAMDLAPRKIRVNAVAPGLVLPSEQTQEEYERRQALTPLGVGLGPADIVQAVLYLVAAEQVTGQTLTVDAGQHLMGFGNAEMSAVSHGRR